jgi:hypothetical protein
MLQRIAAVNARLRNNTTQREAFRNKVTSANRAAREALNAVRSARIAAQLSGLSASEQQAANQAALAASAVDNTAYVAAEDARREAAVAASNRWFGASERVLKSDGYKFRDNVLRRLNEAAKRKPQFIRGTPARPSGGRTRRSRTRRTRRL